jgi:hypothetical protein
MAAGGVAAPWRHGRAFARLQTPGRQAASPLLLPRRGAQGVRCGARLPGAGTADEAERRRDGAGRDAAGLAGASGSGLGGLGAPLASASIASRIWGDRPQNDGPINYAQFMEYLVNKRVLRLLIYDNGKTAIGAPARQAPSQALRARRARVCA